MGTITPLLGQFESLQNGEWGTYLTRPKALDTRSPEALETAELITELGFSHFILILRYVLPAAGPIQIALSNWRMDWYERYWAKDYIKIDPVVAKMLVACLPFDWQDVGLPSPMQRAFFEDAQKHGMVDGIAGAVRFGSDQAAFFSVSSERVCTRQQKLQAMERVFLHTGRIYDRVAEQMYAKLAVAPVVLTGRQREALQLTLRGVSRREASKQMGCSESNFVRHQEAARRKLGEETNLAAVRKAVAMNLIRPYDIVVREDEAA
jgi:DNA-binding CsgD family transcriptional regulator